MHTYSAGLKTNRDAWVYNFSKAEVERNVTRMISTYNDEVAKLHRVAREDGEIPSVEMLRATGTRDNKLISWDGTAEADAVRKVEFKKRASGFRVSTYRPFNREHVYFDRQLNNSVYQLARMFPTPEIASSGIYCVGMGSAVPFSVLMLDTIPDLHVTGAGSGGQFFPRYSYEERQPDGDLLATLDDDGTPYRRVDNVTDEILITFQRSFGNQVTKDEVFFYLYGILHSPDYREQFEGDLKKMLPRIPKVKNFQAFSDAGRRLSELHLDYETVEQYPLVEHRGVNASYRVEKMRYAKSGRGADKSTVIYNGGITVSGIPDEAHEYMLGSRSAIDWIIERYQVKTDKASGIVNDPNDWAEEQGNPRYVLDLLARIVTVSVETVKIVKSLPPLDIVE